MILERLRKRSDVLPCLTVLAGVLCGAANLLLASGGTPDSAGMICLYAACGLIPAWGILGIRRTCLRFLPGVILGVFASVGILREYEASFECRDMAGRLRTGAYAEFVLTDSSLCGGTSEWMANSPGFVSAELLRVSENSSEPLGKASQKVFLTVSRENPVMRHAGFGDVVRAEGFFEKPSPPAFRGVFDFRKYASARGNRLIFHAVGLEPVSRGSGPLRTLYNLRGLFLDSLTAGLPDSSVRDTIPALLFGIRQSIDREQKTAFLYSGTLHVLSVSGFHVGLFCAVLVFLFRGFPFRARWLCIIPTVGIYALSTGMQAPALRAFTMFAVWALFRAFLYRSNPLNTLCLSAVIILAGNPLQFYDVGFQYSFLCVFFLMISGNLIGRTASAMRVRERFSEKRTFLSMEKILGIAVCAVCASMAAWLCGIEITLLNQSIFTPWAVPAYLLMAPFAWIAFAIFTGAILFCWIPGLPELAGVCMAFVLEPLVKTAELFGSDCLAAPPPPIWLALLFPAAFAGIFLFRNSRGIAVSAVVAALAFGAILSGGKFLPPEIILITGGGVRPAIVFCDPPSATAAVINAPPGKNSGIIADLLRSRGIAQISELSFDSSRWDACAGAEFLIRSGVVSSVFPPEEKRKNARVMEKIRTAAQKSGIIPASHSLLDLAAGKNGTVIHPMFPPFLGTVAAIQYSDDTPPIFSLSCPNAPTRFAECSFSPDSRIQSFPLP